ncbi:HD domain-containing protein [Paenisporosarcina cavernae]|uniref:HD domain-containing protein n=1 Tax=Paenisporosarcina cavernae TaxID=2320858 RepID=A0A385YQL9_9BACL|nr:HD domain-containing protein [Paenisporosarcina cavernae]AYC28784.1 HD domain-containing protein [Paenisporosarcina cavernae]
MTYSKQKLTEEKVFKDPVHRYIHVTDQVIWDLINAKEFQRLRRIKQLGTTNLVFHGAEHSRFNHSLGVYEVVRRIIENGFQGRPEWDESERLLVLCAALLHDLGHGPFSHAFEHVFDLDHEQFTQAILTGDTEVHAILSRVRENFAEDVAAVIAKKYPNKQVISLISSQIDADRMDYLLRDAYYTGVSYGQFDMERILRVMRPKDNQVVIKQSGMHAVEHYIMSRYQMYWQVYFHPVSRSAEAILTKALHRAKDLYATGYQFEYAPRHLENFFNQTFSLGEYIDLDEGIVMMYLHEWTKEKDAILSDLSGRFIHRKLFQYVDYDPYKDKQKYADLRLLFQEAGIEPTYYLVMDSSSDLPYDYYRSGKEGERVPIQLLQTDGTLKELSSQSDIVDAISGKRRSDSKMYFPQEVLEARRGEEVIEKIWSLLQLDATN